MADTGRLDALEEWARKLNMLRLLRYLDVRVKGGGLIAGDRLMNRLERDLGDTLVEDLDRPFAAVATEIPTGHEIWLRASYNPVFDNDGNVVRVIKFATDVTERVKAAFAEQGIRAPDRQYRDLDLNGQETPEAKSRPGRPASSG